MSFKNLIIIIVINQIYIFNSSEIVSIPFNSFFKHRTKTNISSIDDLAQTNLYSTISIGEPSYEIKAFLSVQHSYFSITSNHITKNVNEFSSHYDLKKSNSFKNITNSNSRRLFDIKNDFIAKEKFKLNVFNYQKKEHYNISIDDMIFIYDNKKKDTNDKDKKINSYYLNIGFQIINQKKINERNKYNFIYQLKKEISSKIMIGAFFLKYNNQKNLFLYYNNRS